MNTLTTSSSKPSTRELLIFCAATFFFGDMTRFSLADDGLNSEGFDVNKMKAEPRRRGFALGVVGLGGSMVSTVEVRTMGVGIVETREIGRMITSSPSNV